MTIETEVRWEDYYAEGCVFRVVSGDQGPRKDDVAIGRDGSCRRAHTMARGWFQFSAMLQNLSPGLISSVPGRRACRWRAVQHWPSFEQHLAIQGPGVIGDLP